MLTRETISAATCVNDASGQVTPRVVTIQQIHPSGSAPALGQESTFASAATGWGAEYFLEHGACSTRSR
jgi:hypothetical protein